MTNFANDEGSCVSKVVCHVSGKPTTKRAKTCSQSASGHLREPNDESNPALRCPVESPVERS